MDCNGSVDALDVPLFINALLDPTSLSTCDAYTANVNGNANADGTPKIDGDDVQRFVQLLMGP